MEVFINVRADRSLRSLSALSLPQYRPAAYIFGLSGLNSACGLNFRFLPQLDSSSLPAFWALQYPRVV